jgi:hypothetical protein
LSSVPEDSDEIVREKVFRMSFRHAGASSVEGLELIRQVWRDKMDGDSKFRSRLFHGFSAMRGRPNE